MSLAFPNPSANLLLVGFEVFQIIFVVFIPLALFVLGRGILVVAHFDRSLVPTPAMYPPDGAGEHFSVRHA